MKERLAKLIDLKSLITMTVVGVICYLAIVGRLDVAALIAFGDRIIDFYFNKDKKDNKEGV